MMKILFTPGRVIITTDHGLIRRSHTDGRPVPKDPCDTLTGTSEVRPDTAGRPPASAMEAVARGLKLARYLAVGVADGGSALGTRLDTAGIVRRYA